MHKPEDNRDRFRILFEYSADAHLIFDMDGIIDCNDAALKLLSMESKESMIGLHPAVLSPERQPDGRLSSEKSQEMDGLARENGYHRFDWMHCKPDGTPIPVEVTLTQVEFEGREALLTVWHDLTERYERERDLREARIVAEEAMRARERFLATMSHEIRTPLNGVIATAQLLSGHASDERGRELCQIIEDSADHLLYLIDDILDFSKISARQMELHPDAVDLNAMAKRLVGLLRANAAEKDLSITYRVADDVPANVLADGPRLDQIILNLLSNAIKFTHEGSVNLNITVVGESGLSFEVTDTGIGIPPEQVAEIFDPFSQAEDKASRRFGGTGLGLSISRDLARLMGGELVCESALGIGSRFTFTAELPSCEAPKQIEPCCENPSIEGLRVLAVDDNRVNRRVIQILLQSLGCETDFAEDGRGAVSKCKSAAFDLILMDLHMPEMDGFDATKQIRKDGFDRPILALTASTVKQEIAACQEVGMNAVLTKPVRLEDLRKALSSWASDCEP